MLMRLGAPRRLWIRGCARPPGAPIVCLPSTRSIPHCGSSSWADNDLLELEQPLVVGVRTQVGRQLRGLLAVFAEDSLVKGFPQTVDAALGRAGPFRSDVPPLPTNDWASDKAIARTLKRCGIGTVGNYCQS
jgi:hypothetical protein